MAKARTSARSKGAKSIKGVDQRGQSNLIYQVTLTPLIEVTLTPLITPLIAASLIFRRSI